MAAVAVVALLFFSVVQRDRFRKLSVSYAQKAEELRSEEAYERRNIQRSEVVITDIRARLELADDKSKLRLRSLLDEQRHHMARYAEHANYLAELRSKYEKASVSPWFRVAPDPLAPQP
jgi:hypothetical protein